MFAHRPDSNPAELSILQAMTSISVGLNAVILAVTEETPRVLTVDTQRSAPVALPFGPLDPAGDRTLELGLRRWVRERTGLSVGYVEQLYTFGDRDRQTTNDADTRVLSIAYLALARQDESPSDMAGHWRDIYEFLPWEDWRLGSPPAMAKLLPALEAWAESEPGRRESRSERLEINFGLGGARWDGDRVLERYELLWEAGLVPESGAAAADGPTAVLERLGEASRASAHGRAMAHDHRRILATGLGRVRGKIKYRPVVSLCTNRTSAASWTGWDWWRGAGASTSTPAVGRPSSSASAGKWCASGASPGWGCRR
jgi:hypothetical protein